MILLWLDLETTGLDPRTSFILECAWTFTDDKLVGDGVITSRLVTPTPESWHALQGASEVVVRMHAGTGLTDELAHAAPFLMGLPISRGDVLVPSVSLRDLEQELVAELVKHRDADGLVQLAGASVHFDLGFIRQHMPELAGMLSHRVYDTSTLKALASSIGVDITVDNPYQHRAAADVLEALSWAMSFRNIVAPAPKLNRLVEIANLRGAQNAFDAYVQNLREMSRRPGAGRAVTVEGLITALKKSAQTFGDQADLALLRLDD